MRNTFDKAYYDRYYRNPQTRVFTPAVARRQATFIASYLKHLEIPITNILDIGCGVGTVLKTLGKEFPRAQTRGVEHSGYLCRRYGWAAGSVVDYRSDHPYDLVVCNDVVGYLSDKVCTTALANLAELSASVLYLGVLTREDYEICDQNRTDPQQWMRPAAWYRRRLTRHFVNVGGGLFLKKPLHVTIWHLDRLGNL